MNHTVRTSLRTEYAEHRRPLLLAAAALSVFYLVGGLLGTLGAMSTTAGALDPAGAGQASVWSIFGHNLGVLAWLASGTWCLGLTTAATVLFNGSVLGWVVGKSVLADGAGSLVTGILPHALPELGSYVLGGAASLVLAVRLLGRWTRRERPATSPPWLLWFVLQAVSVGLLAVGAVVEVVVSHV